MRLLLNVTSWRSWRPPSVLCVAALAFAPAAFPQTIPPTLDACSAESDAGRRLACFDREIARLHQLQQRRTAGAQGPGAEGTAGSPEAGAPHSGAGGPNASGGSGAPSEPAPARAGSNTTIAAKDPNAVEDFGLTPEMKHQRQAEGKVPTPLREISAHVSSVHYLPRGEIVLGLDNGQTWQQAEYDGDVDMAVGEAVTIKAGALSAYYMKPRVGRIIRVKRLR